MLDYEEIISYYAKINVIFIYNYFFGHEELGKNKNGRK